MTLTMTSFEKICPAWIRSLCLQEAVSAPFLNLIGSLLPLRVRVRFPTVLPLSIILSLLLRMLSSPLLLCRKRSGAAPTRRRPLMAWRLELTLSACTRTTTTSRTRKCQCRRSPCSLFSLQLLDTGRTLLPLKTLQCLNLLHLYLKRRADTVSIRALRFEHIFLLYIQKLKTKNLLASCCKPWGGVKPDPGLPPDQAKWSRSLGQLVVARQLDKLNGLDSTSWFCSRNRKTRHWNSSVLSNFIF